MTYRGGLHRRPSVSAEVPITPSKYVPAPKFPKSEQQIADIRDAIQENFLFQGLSLKQTFDVIDCMFERKVAAGEQVMAQGDDADNFYVVASGRLDAVKDGQVVCEYDGHGTFGELALMYNCPRAASVVARTDALLWALEGLTFKRLLIADRQKRADVSTAMLTRMPVLNYLDQHQIAKLADALTHHEFGAGEVIFSQGELGSLFFLVEEGEAVGTFEATDGSAKQVATFVPGDYFGERALLTDEPRSLTVRAVTELKLLSLDTPAFERILGPCKGAMAERIARYERLGEQAEHEPEEE